MIKVLFLCKQVPLDESYEDIKEFYEEIRHLARRAVLELVTTPALPVLKSSDILATAISGLGFRRSLCI